MGNISRKVYQKRSILVFFNDNDIDNDIVVIINDSEEQKSKSSNNHIADEIHQINVDHDFVDETVANSDSMDQLEIFHKKPSERFFNLQKIASIYSTA